MSQAYSVLNSMDFQREKVNIFRKSNKINILVFDNQL